MRKYQI